MSLILNEDASDFDAPAPDPISPAVILHAVFAVLKWIGRGCLRFFRWVGRGVFYRNRPLRDDYKTVDLPTKADWLKTIKYKSHID